MIKNFIILLVIYFVTAALILGIDHIKGIIVVSIVIISIFMICFRFTKNR